MKFSIKKALAMAPALIFMLTTPFQTQAILWRKGKPTTLRPEFFQCPKDDTACQKDSQQLDKDLTAQQNILKLVQGTFIKELVEKSAPQEDAPGKWVTSRIQVMPNQYGLSKFRSSHSYPITIDAKENHLETRYALNHIDRISEQSEGQEEIRQKPYGNLLAPWAIAFGKYMRESRLLGGLSTLKLSNNNNAQLHTNIKMARNAFECQGQLPYTPVQKEALNKLHTEGKAAALAYIGQHPHEFKDNRTVWNRFTTACMVKLSSLLVLPRKL